MKSVHKIKVGFLIGGVATLFGFVFQLTTGRLAPYPDRVTLGVWKDFFLLLMVFGLIIVAVTFNRWLQSDREQ